MNPQAADYAQIMPDVARRLLGEPNSRFSTVTEWRYGNNGSLSINLQKGTWFDFERATGGGVKELVADTKGYNANGQADDWLRAEGLLDDHHRPPLQTRDVPHRFRVVNRWQYLDEAGDVLYEVERLEDGETSEDGKKVKRYRQRRPAVDSDDPEKVRGGYVYNVKGVRRVPYRLPELIENLAAECAVFIAEGEKKVDALYRIGIPATCNAMGARKWAASLTPFFAGADVVILPDNDDPGRDHAALVAAALNGVAARVRVLEIPGLKPKGDVADWIAAGGSAEALHQLVETCAANWKPSALSGVGSDEASGGARPAGIVLDPQDPIPIGVVLDPQDPIGVVLDPHDPIRIARGFLAAMFTDRAGRRMIHHHQDQFLHFIGGFYTGADENDVRAAIWTFLEAAFRRGTEGKLLAFRPKSRDVSNVLDALAAACNLDAGVTPPAWLSGDRSLAPAQEFIAVGNGLLHLPTGKLSKATPDFFTLSGTSVAYDPRAPQPTQWLRFVADLFGDDHQSIVLLQDWFGYLLSTDTDQQKILLIVGPKRSGKGTIARVLRAMLHNSVVSPTLSSLSLNFGLAPLIGKRLAVIADARLGHRPDQAVIAERLLSISGEDAMTIDRKFKSAWNGQLGVRFMLITNELPRLSDSSGALASRFLVMVLKNSFYGREDHGLGDRLLTELPGILNWARAGYERLRQRGFFEQPDTGREAMEELESLASPTIAFVRDRCRLGAGLEIDVPVLFEAWKAWCDANGRKEPGDTQTFGRNLRAAFPGIEAKQKRAVGNRLRVYAGVDLQR